jgi:FecR protein
MAQTPTAKRGVSEGEIIMKPAFSSIPLKIAALVLLLAAPLVLSAQNREKFVITAKAGGVNSVSGRVEVKGFRGADWVALSVTDDLRTGNVVRTGTDGRVEMLLNPGSFLRIGENSEFELTDNSLENLEVRLIQGTAIIEATGADTTELAINITTPHARMVIVRRGLYRVNVIPGDATELFVRKGRVLLAHSQTKIKEGNKVVFSSTAFSVAKIQKAEKQKDNLDAWSKQRAEVVAQVNRRIPTRELNSFMSGLDTFWWASFSASSSGVWLFSPYSHCFTFMPFYLGWGSPYGASYSRIFDCGCFGLRGFNNAARTVYTSPTVWPSNSGSSRPGSGPSTGPGSGPSPGPAIPRVSPTANADWPGRSTGKPDTNPGGGRPRTP